MDALIIIGAALGTGLTLFQMHVLWGNLTSRNPPTSYRGARSSMVRATLGLVFGVVLIWALDGRAKIIALFLASYWVLVLLNEVITVRKATQARED